MVYKCCLPISKLNLCLLRCMKTPSRFIVILTFQQPLLPLRQIHFTLIHSIHTWLTLSFFFFLFLLFLNCVVWFCLVCAYFSSLGLSLSLSLSLYSFHLVYLFCRNNSISGQMNQMMISGCSDKSALKLTQCVWFQFSVYIAAVKFDVV